MPRRPLYRRRKTASVKRPAPYPKTSGAQRIELTRVKARLRNIKAL